MWRRLGQGALHGGTIAYSVDSTNIDSDSYNLQILTISRNAVTGDNFERFPKQQMIFQNSGLKKEPKIKSKGNKKQELLSQKMQLQKPVQMLAPQQMPIQQMQMEEPLELMQTIQEDVVLEQQQTLDGEVTEQQQIDKAIAESLKEDTDETTIEQSNILNDPDKIKEDKNEKKSN